MINKLNGTTIKYSGNGRKLGYPTANFAVNSDVADGVYISFSTLNFSKLKGQKLPSMTFIGVPTTVGDTPRRVEVHLFDIADMDYYDCEIETELIHKIRDNKTFNSVDELLGVMKTDERIAREYFRNA